MTSALPFFCVRTSTLLNCDGTGYRGPHRSAPEVIPFAKGDMELWQQFSHEDSFSELSRAVDEMEFARRHNILSEIIECEVVLPDEKLEKARVKGDLLGYDVVQPSSFYSPIVDRCMGLWVPSEPAEAHFSTLLVVAEFFNAMLNENRLFAEVGQAERFLRVDRECASRFEGEMSCGDLAIVSVRLVR